MPVWAWWLIWATAAVGSLYFLALVILRLRLSLSGLQANLKATARFLRELEQTELPKLVEASAATGEDLVRLTALRSRQKRSKARSREQRQRRLIAHIRKVEEKP